MSTASLTPHTCPSSPGLLGAHADYGNRLVRPEHYREGFSGVGAGKGRGTVCGHCHERKCPSPLLASHVCWPRERASRRGQLLRGKPRGLERKGGTKGL